MNCSSLPCSVGSGNVLIDLMTLNHKALTSLVTKNRPGIARMAQDFHALKKKRGASIWWMVLILSLEDIVNYGGWLVTGRGWTSGGWRPILQVMLSGKRILVKPSLLTLGSGHYLRQGVHGRAVPLLLYLFINLIRWLDKMGEMVRLDREGVGPCPGGGIHRQRSRYFQFFQYFR